LEVKNSNELAWLKSNSAVSLQYSRAPHTNSICPQTSCPTLSSSIPTSPYPIRSEVAILENGGAGSPSDSPPRNESYPCTSSRRRNSRQRYVHALRPSSDCESLRKGWFTPKGEDMDAVFQDSLLTPALMHSNTAKIWLTSSVRLCTRMSFSRR
jgi:hypothetical protein